MEGELLRLNHELRHEAMARASHHSHSAEHWSECATCAADALDAKKRRRLKDAHYLEQTFS